MRKFIISTLILFAVALPLASIWAQSATTLDQACVNAALLSIMELAETGGVNALEEVRDAADEALLNCQPATVTPTPSSGGAFRGRTFSVVTNNAVNLRTCAGTNCAIIRSSRAGEIFDAATTETATDGTEWHRVNVDGQNGYVAASLTTRGPDAVINTQRRHVDLDTLCVIAFDIQRGSADLQFIISGDARDDVIVDIFRPGETRALAVQAQNIKTFVDTGDIYIQQYYSYSVGWPLGVYHIELEFEGVTKRFAFEMTQRGTHNVHVMCD